MKSKENLVFLGMMGSGKSSIGSLVAKKLKLNLEWKGQGINEVAIDKKNNKIVIDVNKKFFRPTEVEYLKGNFKKAKALLKWKPRHNIETLIDDMINYEIKNS